MDHLEWNAELDQYVTELNERRGQVMAAPGTHDGPYAFPIVHHQVTDDLIHRFAHAIGDANPLWNDDTYTRRSDWQGLVGPPLFEVCISEGPSQPDPPAIPGWSAFNGGMLRRYFRPFRPGQTISADDEWLGIDEKSSEGRPYRLFLTRARRTFRDQSGETLSTCEGRIVCMANPPDQREAMTDTAFAGRVRERYSIEILDMVHRHYDDELSGKFRRGAEPRYFEDVRVGDELPPVMAGPYDISDAVSLYAVMGFVGAFARKWEQHGGENGRSPRDPETGELHHPIDWHFLDPIARLSGMPFAHAFGTHEESFFSRAVTNWMGDDAVLREVDPQLRRVFFHGDISETTGSVEKLYVDDEGRHLADVSLTSKTVTGGIEYARARVTIELPSRERGSRPVVMAGG